MSSRSIWVGYDDREVLPYAVARHSLTAWSSGYTSVHGVVLTDLCLRGWYKRQTEVRPSKFGGKILWDVVSDASMSTQFAISRFFTPMLADAFSPDERGWAMFVDCDILARADIDEVFYRAEHDFGDKALLCVPHQHKVVEGEHKKQGQIQMNYARKNWSSVMMFNRGHPANRKLTLELLNRAPGRDLHAFCWLTDDQIGFIDPKWNHLVGLSEGSNPAIVHFTNGGPWLPEYADVPYAEEWRQAYASWLE